MAKIQVELLPRMRHIRVICCCCHTETFCGHLEYIMWDILTLYFFYLLRYLQFLTVTLQNKL